MPLLCLLPRCLRLPSSLSFSSPTTLLHRFRTMATVSTNYTDKRVDELLSGKYPAKAHAEKVANYLRKIVPGLTDGLIFLESQKSQLHEDCDQEAEFRQRRAFFYLSGCNLPDSFVTYHLTSRTLTLYIPPLDPAEVVWCGLPLSPEQAMQKYDVDAVRTTAELESDFELALSNVANIFAIPHKETHPALPSSANTSLLHDAINECRVTKSPYEVALIRRANQITAGAHRLCMSSIKKSKNERELQGLFLGHCVASGAPGQAYTGIFGAGKAAATLHYIHNNAPLEGKQLLLLDAGCEYDNYASDVTRTFPISGEFTKEGRQIYDIVLRMQKETMAQCKAGNSWDDIHILAHRVAIQGLLDIGVLHNGTVDEILESRTSTAFLPHGLGHYLGMDTHDTGGHPNYQDKDKLFCYLRKRGPLPTGAVITVEPGLYFCEFIIKPFLSDAKHSKYINAQVLEKYWDVGGVRIEDNILITDDGYENLTSVEKEAEEIMKIINDA